MLTIKELEAALQRCMNAEPPKDYCLSKDSNSLATVLAEMQYFRQEEKPLDSLTEKQRAALDRWRF